MNIKIKKLKKNSTGLVGLYIVGLLLRFCWTIGPPSEL